MLSSTVNSTEPPTAAAHRPLVVFAGGGSGGHLFPGLAVAERLAEIDPDVESLFFCSNRKIDASILSAAGASFRPLPAQPIALKPFPGGLVRFVTAWRLSVTQVERELRPHQRARRSVVMAFMGGFVAAPAARAARRLGVPSILVNLDAVPGKANRLVARLADRVITAVPCPSHPGFNATVVGMPIRRSAVASDGPSACRRRLGLDAERPTLLVTGASQGAGTFNRLIMDLLADRPAAFEGWQVLHLTGELDYEEVAEAYRRHRVPGSVIPFCRDMASAWGAADLALSRCGASSVAEALANHVPTLFSPYPWHRDQHQRLNAIDEVRAGRAWLVDDAIDPQENLEVMGGKLLELMAEGSARADVRERLRGAPRTDAAQAIARILLDVWQMRG